MQLVVCFLICEQSDFRLHVAVLGRLFTHHGGAWANSAFHFQRSVNEDQLRLGRQRQLRFIPFVDKRAGDR